MTEFMDRGSLATHIGESVHYEESAIAYVCKCVLEAIAVIHAKQFIHCGSPLLSL